MSAALGSGSTAAPGMAHAFAPADGGAGAAYDLGATCCHRMPRKSRRNQPSHPDCQYACLQLRRLLEGPRPVGLVEFRTLLEVAARPDLADLSLEEFYPALVARWDELLDELREPEDEEVQGEEVSPPGAGDEGEGEPPPPTPPDPDVEDDSSKQTKRKTRRPSSPQD